VGTIGERFFLVLVERRGEMIAYHFISPGFATRYSNEVTGVGHTLSCEGDLAICTV
jgi:hypothetical protein